MPADFPAETPGEPFLSGGADVEQILIDRGWLASKDTREPDARIGHWCVHAAALLGPHAKDRPELTSLLELIFSYSAPELLGERENQAVLARAGAREIIRELANYVLADGEIDSDRFKEMIEKLKTALPYRSRALFQPIRLVLAGKTGEGELDRVILLLDSASKLDFSAPVKSARQRMLEFCAALD